MPTVSLALIVRDEERVLARCLESVHGSVDEIVIVDTGSIDGTKDVARRYTDKVFDFAWCDDFAAARQFSFDRTTSEWVGWIDADDVVLNAAAIRDSLAAQPPETGSTSWRYIYEHDVYGNPAYQYWRERCARNDGSYRWVGRIHEYLQSSVSQSQVQVPEIVVEHFREQQRTPAKMRRNLALLERELAESGGAPSARLLLHLGRDYASAGKVRKAVPLIWRYLACEVHPEERYLAHVLLGQLYLGQRHYPQAIDAALQGLAMLPEWPDAYFLLAEIYYYLADWRKVVHWIHLGRLMPVPDTIQIVNPLSYTYNWIIFYTNALYRLGATGEALEWTERALALTPTDAQHAHNRTFFLGELGVSE